MTPAQSILKAVQARLDASGAFGTTTLEPTRLVANAKSPAEPAFYHLELDPTDHTRLWISLVTPSRWLSESIESALVEHGDDLNELVEDELIELGYEGPGLPPTFQHFRSPERLYTFRTPIPPVAFTSQQSAIDHVCLWVLAYEQAFRRLGDMEVATED